MCYFHSAEWVMNYKQASSLCYLQSKTIQDSKCRNVNQIGTLFFFKLHPGHNCQSYRNRVYSDERSAQDCNIVAPPPADDDTREETTQANRAGVSPNAQSGWKFCTGAGTRDRVQLLESRPDPTARSRDEVLTAAAFNSDRKARGARADSALFASTPDVLKNSFF